MSVMSCPVRQCNVYNTCNNKATSSESKGLTPQTLGENYVCVFDEWLLYIVLCWIISCLSSTFLDNYGIIKDPCDCFISDKVFQWFVCTC